MSRLMLFVLCVHSACAAPALAGDYLLRLDTIGFVDQPKSGKAPQETVLRRIEVVVRPGAAIHSKVRFPKQTVLLSGALHPADRGKFEARIRYVYAKHGTTAVTERGEVDPMVDESSFSTTVTVSPGTPVDVGGITTEQTQTLPAGTETTTSSRRHVLHLMEYASVRSDAP